MPKYSFDCPFCNLRFERTLKIGDHTSHPCPSCGDEAGRVMDSFGFSFAEGSGATANSGVHDHDYPTADKAVGRDADKRWSVIREREKVKEAAREKSGERPLIRHNAPAHIDYEPMSQAGVAGRKSLATRAKEIVQSARERSGR